MYTVIIKDNFIASHYVKMPDGSIEEAHEHNWKLDVALSTDKLDKNGFAVEFLELKSLIGDITQELEGNLLNNMEYFAPNFPTTEIVCKYVYDNLKNSLPFGATLEYTILEEAQGCCVKYAEKDRR